MILLCSRKRYFSPAGFFVCFFLLSLCSAVSLCVASDFSPEYVRVTPYAVPPKPHYRSTAPLSKGKFLVAGKNLKGSVFSGSVILLVDYGWHGAVGLVINRPTKVKLSMALPDLKGVKGRPDRVYWGGPVATNRLTFLFRSRGHVKGAEHVFRDIYVSSSLDVLERVIAGGKDAGVLRVYGGYAGWAPRQLEGEIARGGWRVMGADDEVVFEPDKRTGLKDSP